MSDPLQQETRSPPPSQQTALQPSTQALPFPECSISGEIKPSIAHISTAPTSRLPTPPPTADPPPAMQPHTAPHTAHFIIPDLPPRSEAQLERMNSVVPLTAGIPVRDGGAPNEVGDETQGGNGKGPQTYTVNEAIEHIGFGKYQILLLMYTGLAWAADACEMMLLSFLGPAVRCDWALSSAQEALLTSIVFLGTILGSYLWGLLADCKGRRRSFAATTMFIFTFGLSSAVASSYAWLVLLRGLVGVGLGGVPVAFTLFTEFCPAEGRGVWLVVLQSFWTAGTMAEALLAWCILLPWGWRWLLGLSAIPSVFLLLLYTFLPESPHWLAISGRTAEADVVLRRIAAMNGVTMPPGRLEATPSVERAPDGAQGPGVDNTLCELRAKACAWVGAGVGKTGGMLSQLFSPVLRRTSALLYCIWFGTAVGYYGLVLLVTTLRVEEGKKGCAFEGGPNLTSADFQSIFITSAAEVLGLLLVAVLVDWLGRKGSMAGGLVVAGALTLGLLGSSSEALLFFGRAGITGAFTALFIFTPEVYPTSLRSLGVGCANSFSRLGALVSPYISVMLVRNGHIAAAVGLLGGSCLAAAACVLILPVETKGRALQASIAEMEGGEIQLLPVSMLRSEDSHTGDSSQDSNSSDDLKGDAGGLLLDDIMHTDSTTAFEKDEEKGVEP